jgi:YidC/Oxa1 family membrane protein insertase
VILLASILQPLEDAAEAVLKLFHDDVGLTWGTSIIALTIVVRAVLIPLTYKQIKGMRALQALQPQMKQIQEKYKNDRQRMQQEMMRFYQENKINPLASCLPLILQLPIFFALFQLLNGGSFEEDVEATGGQGWFFISSVIENPQGAELVILMLLFAGSMALSTLVTMRSSPSTGGSNQQYILIGAFSLVGLFFVPTFPAGLSLYWITTNFWTVLQSYAAAKLIPAPEPPTPEEIAAAKPPPPPPKKKKRRR